MEDYICYECGTRMELEGDVLVCPKCGHSVDLEDYYDEEETYEAIYGPNPNEKSDDFWETSDEFPEEFPGEKYEDIYK